MHSREDSGLTASSSCDPPIDKRDTCADWGRKSQFSFAREPAETTGLQQEIRSYIKKFEKGVDADDINAEITRYSSFNIDEYDLQGRKESLLFDRVSFKNRIESGSLYLCDGGLAISFLPFPSVI